MMNPAGLWLSKLSLLINLIWLNGLSELKEEFKSIAPNEVSVIDCIMFPANLLLYVTVGLSLLNDTLQFLCTLTLEMTF